MSAGFKINLIITIIWPIVWLSLPMTSFAFGPDGHRIVGQIASQHLTPAVARQVAQLLQNQPLAEVCNWADEMRGQPGYETTGPLHYVNLPPRERTYVAERDCRNGNCVVGAIERFTAELGDHSLGQKQRSEALKFVCHFVADLHQPLHTGYAHDRGGNSFDVRWGNGESGSLHQLWDQELVSRLGPWRDEAAVLSQHCQPELIDNQLLDWLGESRTLVLEQIYPAGHQLDAAYLARHTATVSQQLCLAGCRLAGLLNVALR